MPSNLQHLLCLAREIRFCAAAARAINETLLGAHSSNSFSHCEGPSQTCPPPHESSYLRRCILRNTIGDLIATRERQHTKVNSGEIPNMRPNSDRSTKLLIYAPRGEASTRSNANTRELESRQGVSLNACLPFRLNKSPTFSKRK